MTQIQKIKRKLIHRPPRLSSLHSLIAVDCDSIETPKTKSPSPSEGGNVFFGHWILGFVIYLEFDACKLEFALLYNTLKAHFEIPTSASIAAA